MNDTLDDDLSALATIDPAGPRDPGAHLSFGARRLQSEILATEHPAPVVRKRRWPVLLGAAAALTVGLVLTPNLVGGDAYGSWTDVPAAASAADAAAAADQCREMWMDIVADGPTAEIPGPEQVAQAELVLAERRGNFTYTVVSDGVWSMDCLIQQWSLLSPMSRGSAGSLQNLSLWAEPEPASVAAVSLAGMGTDDEEGLVLFMYGRVGNQVRDVVAHVPDIGSVQATVTDGFFAVWAPGLSEEHFDDGVGLTLYLEDGSEVSLTPDQVSQTSVP
jgi:hypothetical protein